MSFVSSVTKGQLVDQVGGERLPSLLAVRPLLLRLRTAWRRARAAALFPAPVRPCASPAAPPPLTGDAKAYLKYLRFVTADGQALESPKMVAHESYMKQSVVEITGNIQNTGDRVVEVIEINCVFYDPYGQMVLRERVPVVTRKMGKLAPGESKAFRLAFGHVREGWNHPMPRW